MSFQRYLEAKKTVEDGCLNLRVLGDVRRRMKTEIETETDVSIFEAGAGVGSMVKHLVERDAVPDRFTYTAVDVDGKNVEVGRESLAEWGGEHGYAVEREGDVLRFDGAKSFDVEFVEGDLYEHEVKTDRRYDLVVAHALLDVLDLRRATERLLSLGDYFYFPVCFDGITSFEPPFEETDEETSFDARVERAYHATMDTDDRTGSSKTGRRAFEAVRSAGGTVTSAGASDWVLFPGEGGYTDDEEVLLYHILDTVHCAVREEGSLDTERLDAWLNDRIERIEDEDLVYVAHQIDIAGRC